MAMHAPTHLCSRVLFFGLLGWLLGIGRILAARDADVSAERLPRTELDEVSSLPLALELLRSGLPEEKRLAVEEAYVWADTVDFDDESDKEALEAVESLRSILRGEPDDWIVSRLLQNLADNGGALLGPLYREALERGSANSQWRAIHWFSLHPDPRALPLLEDAWREEKRPWVRVDLMQALAVNGSTGIFDDLVENARDRDPDISLAAVKAIHWFGGEAALQALIRLSRDVPSPAGAEAAAALADWPESLEALEALLEATRSGETDIGLVSIAALGRFKTERASRRLVEIAEEGEEAMRSAALDSLASSPPAGFAELLISIARRPFGSEAALSQLWALDDITVVPDLEAILPAADGEYRTAVEGLLRHLERDRAPAPDDRLVLTSTCGGAFSSRKGPEYRVVPFGDLHTIRCWEFPGVAGLPEDFPRIPAGAPVYLQDHFEMEGASWVEVSGPEADDCWIPFAALVPAPAEPEPPDSDDDAAAFRREADIARGELRSKAAEVLWEAGILEVVDETEQVVGIVLSIDPLDRRAVRALALSYRDDDSDLDWEISELLDEMLEAAPSQPDLRTFFLDQLTDDAAEGAEGKAPAP
jgi:HEAT repeat protein